MLTPFFLTPPPKLPPAEQGSDTRVGKERGSGEVVIIGTVCPRVVNRTQACAVSSEILEDSGEITPCPDSTPFPMAPQGLFSALTTKCAPGVLLILLFFQASFMINAAFLVQAGAFLYAQYLRALRKPFPPA